MDKSHHAKLRAPTEDGGILLWPESAHWGSLAEANRFAVTRKAARVLGFSWYELAARARQEMLAAARRWTGRYRSVEFSETGSAHGLPPIYMTGHQPELFHPGVWLKNAVLHGAAQAGSAIAIHMIVDSDVLKGLAVSVPSGAPEQPRMSYIPLDEGPCGWPYEERPVINREVFGTFDLAVSREIRGLVPDPLVGKFWPIVRESLDVSPRLAHAIAVARHRQEERWGWQTLEVPQSWLCRLPSFLVLAAHIWSEAPRFLALHNRAVDAYRRAHRLRSRSHPFPHLIETDGWIEVPFWTWSLDMPYRQRLFARHSGNCVEISDLAHWWGCIPDARLNDPEWLADWAADLEKNGRRIRGRAVVTTLWARCFLSDFFIHGLGGAKYDQVTDAIIRDFLGIDPPVYATATATVLLPVWRPAVDEADERAIRVQLRDLEFHPEKHISLGELPRDAQRLVEKLIEEKWRWINTAVTPENAADRYRRIREINRALQPFVENERQRLLQLLDETQQKLKVKQILAARDWAFCLYPEDQLMRFYASAIQDIAG
ncbi:hypothetical protein [Thermogutta terrifontis]|nr:hypothetical protein [Thermogutta terrifontis]